MFNYKEKLTIILTLKDRVSFTYRWMEYMNDICCPYKILIADGGKDKDIEEHLTVTSNYPNLNYTYLRYPYDQNFSFYYKKFVDVVGRVTTPYLQFADNDDFFLLERYAEFIEYLDHNPEVVSCGGKSINLNLVSKYNITVNASTAENYIASLHNLPQSVAQDSASERITYFFENVERNILWWAYYNLHRTTAIQNSFEFLKIYEFKEIVAFEIHIHISLLFAGKYKELNFPFYIRQEGTSQLTHQVNNENNLIQRFIRNNTFFEIQKSLDSICKGLSEEDKIIINNGIILWFVNSAVILYSKVPVNHLRNFIKGIFLKSNKFWIFYYFKYLQQAAKILMKDKRRYIRLPYLEKFITNKF